jgi:hypothetical protein
MTTSSVRVLALRPVCRSVTEYVPGASADGGLARCPATLRRTPATAKLTPELVSSTIVQPALLRRRRGPAGRHAAGRPARASRRGPTGRRRRPDLERSDVAARAVGPRDAALVDGEIPDTGGRDLVDRGAAGAQGDGLAVSCLSLATPASCRMLLGRQWRNRPTF